MVVAVAARSNSAEGEVDERFCTAKCFHLIDTETHDVEIVENGPGLESTPELEDRAADMMIDKEVDIVLADHYGPIALRALRAAGIKVIGAVHGTVSKVVESYCEEDYQSPDCADAEPWWNWR